MRSSRPFMKRRSGFTITLIVGESTATDVCLVLERAAGIEQFMRRYPLTEKAQNDWYQH